MRLIRSSRPVWFAFGLALALGPPAGASSHREAPFITEHPKVDGTDFYLFRGYEPGRESFTTLIANYAPLQDAYGGPNYFALDPEAAYEIHVDNNGDAREDITFRFRARLSRRETALNVGGVSVPIPLVISGPVSAPGDPDQNQAESYTLEVIRGDRRTGAVAACTDRANGSPLFPKPLDFIGEKTLGAPAAYEAYARTHVRDVDIPGCGTPGRVFVGQRDEPFALRLGEIFDLVNVTAGVATGPRDALPDILRGKNVTTFALEVPTACLLAASPTLGAWTTASLRQGRVLNPCPNVGNPSAIESGAWVQVSRLGMPLVNEVVIGLRDKDRFNASEPAEDAQFLTYVTHPTLPELLEILFPTVLFAPDTFPRSDLVAVFLTGVSGLNLNGSTGEMQRLNTSIAPVGIGGQNDLGVLGGDTAGFPNGRRPGDDVVDVALRVMMGALLPGPGQPGNLSGLTPLTDGVRVVTEPTSLGGTGLPAAFPYLNPPWPGAVSP